MNKTTTSHHTISIRQVIILFFQVIIPLLIFYTALSLDIPRQVGLTFRYGFSSILLPYIFILFLTFHSQSKVWKSVSLCLTLFLFAMPLSGLWMSGAGEKTIIAGLFPWSDANAYYDSALKFLEGIKFSGIASRRTLFPGYLVTLLWASHSNLQMTMALMTLLAAFSCYILAREVQKVNGTGAAVLMLAFLFIYHRRFIGTTMSENLGLPLGVLGFTFLWRGIRVKKDWYLYAGFFIITLALNARAGAFFILPALILWFASLKSGNWKLKEIIKPALIASLPVFLGFVLNLVLFNILSSPESQPFANFSFTLYGVVSGGVGWNQILIDHPELQLLSTEEYNRRCYELAFEAFKNNPTGIILGSLRSYGDFFSLKDISVFGYLKTDSALFNQLIRLGAMLLSGWGLWYCIKNLKNPYFRMLSLSIVGILLSVPFAPPIDAEEMRAYAATISFIGILPIIGLFGLITHLKPNFFLFNPTESLATDALLPFSVVFIALIIFMPLILLPTRHTPEINEIQCPEGEDAVYLRYNQGSYINIVKDDGINKTRLPDIEWNKYDRSIHNSMHSSLVSEFSGHEAPFTLITAPDMKRWQQVWLFIDTPLLPEAPQTIAVCGVWSVDEPEDWIVQAFYGHSVQPISVP